MNQSCLWKSLVDHCSSRCPTAYAWRQGGSSVELRVLCSLVALVFTQWVRLKFSSLGQSHQSEKEISENMATGFNDNCLQKAALESIHNAKAGKAMKTGLDIGNRVLRLKCLSEAIGIHSGYNVEASCQVKPEVDQGAGNSATDLRNQILTQRLVIIISHIYIYICFSIQLYIYIFYTVIYVVGICMHSI